MVVEGAEGLSNAIAEVLSDQRFTDELLRLETSLGLQQGSLATRPTTPTDTGLVPNYVAPYEDDHLELSQFPAIIVMPARIIRTEHVFSTADVHPALAPGDPDADEYRHTYVMSIAGYIVGQDKRRVSVARNRFELAFRRTLLRSRSVGDNAALDRNSYTVEYQDVLDSVHEGFVSGFEAKVSAWVTEDLPTPVMGRADTIGAGVTRLSWTDE